jgi:hypothetical protein
MREERESRPVLGEEVIEVRQNGQSPLQSPELTLVI